MAATAAEGEALVGHQVDKDVKTRAQQKKKAEEDDSEDSEDESSQDSQDSEPTAKKSKH